MINVYERIEFKLRDTEDTNWMLFYQKGIDPILHQDIYHPKLKI